MQLSKYVSDDTYVKKQKEDIEELATMFKGMLGKSEKEDEEAYIETFRAQFAPQPEFRARLLNFVQIQASLYSIPLRSLPSLRGTSEQAYSIHSRP